MPEHDWLDMGRGVFYDRVTQETFNVAKELRELNAHSPTRSPQVTNPNAPIDFTKPVFPGYQNAQWIDVNTARQLLTQISPDYVNNPAARVQMDQYLQQIQNDEGALTPRRTAELGLAARTAFGGDPEQIVRQRMIEAGRAVPFEKLPPALASDFQKLGVTEEGAAEALAVFYPDLPPDKRLEKYVAATQLPDAALPPDYAQPRGATGQLSPEQLAAIKQRSILPTASVAQRTDGTVSTRGTVWGTG